MRIPKFDHNTDVITAYIRFLELQDKKARTVENKLFSIYPYFQYFGERDIKTTTRSDIEQYAAQLKKSGKANSSIHQYLFGLKFFFNWFMPDNDFFKDIKIKLKKVDHGKHEYVNVEDVKKMLKCCSHQRDRAFIFVLWESAGRLEEVLNINIEDIRPDQTGITVHLNGKTGERDVLLIDAVPDVLSLLNLLKIERGALFTTNTGARLSITGAQALVRRAAERAGIKDKKFNVHAFRHGRLTELANLGMSEMQLRLFAGWTADSEMPATYIHTKKKDVFNKLKQIKGIVPDEPETVTLATKPVSCPSCGTDNPFDAVACYRCRAVLDSKLAVEIANEENKRKQEMETLKNEIIKLQNRIEERDKVVKWFEGIKEEEAKQISALEDEIGMGFADICELDDGRKLLANRSETLKEHYRRLRTDSEYRENFKNSTIECKKQRIEKAQSDDVIQTLGKRSRLKTLADEL